MDNYAATEQAYKNGYLKGYDKGLEDALDITIVRCEDCKWYQEGHYLAPNKFCFRLKHPYSDDHIGYNWSPDDFCSRGERREDNEGLASKQER